MSSKRQFLSRLLRYLARTIAVFIILIPVLVFLFFAAPVGFLIWDEHKLKQPVRYEAALDAGIEIFRDMEARNEKHVTLNPYDENDKRLTALKKASAPVEFNGVYADRENDEYVMTISFGGGHFHWGYRMHKYSNEEYMTIEIYRGSGSGKKIFLKKIPYGTSKSDAP